MSTTTSTATNRPHNQPPKLKPPSLFSCAMFRTCAGQPILSPTTTSTPSSTLPLPPPSPSPPPPPPPPPPPQQQQQQQPSSSSSSSSSTSQSFTQWRFPLSHPTSSSLCHSLLDSFHAADLHFSSADRLSALHLLSSSLTASVTPPLCPHSLLTNVVESLLESTTSRPASKVLLALVLADHNRRPAVESGAITAVFEVVSSGGTTAAERALAAMELMCSTVPEAAAEVRVLEAEGGVLAKAAARMKGRGKECAIGVLSAVYGGEWADMAPETVVTAVAAAVQGECSVRGRRKGGQLLRKLQEIGRLDGIGVDL